MSAAANAVDAKVDESIKVYIARFDAGKKRHAEKNKCATAMKSQFFMHVVSTFSATEASLLEIITTLQTLLTRAHATTEDSFAREAVKDSRHLKEQTKWDKQMDKLNTIVERYQLNSISLMPRQESIREWKQRTRSCWQSFRSFTRSAGILKLMSVLV